MIATYIEIDFPEITSKKAMVIGKSKELSKELGSPTDIHLCELLSTGIMPHPHFQSQLMEALPYIRQSIIYYLLICVCHLPQPSKAFWFHQAPTQEPDRFCLQRCRRSSFLNVFSSTCPLLHPRLFSAGSLSIFLRPTEKQRYLEVSCMKCLDWKMRLGG